GSCAAPSAKGDDKFITTDYLQQCRLSPPTICNSAVLMWFIFRIPSAALLSCAYLRVLRSFEVPTSD
ncbi:hypothetical protein QS504_26050, partial [Escherichia coli]|nr:hypothetical protein [Escherichia coli]